MDFNLCAWLQISYCEVLQTSGRQCGLDVVSEVFEGDFIRENGTWFVGLCFPLHKDMGPVRGGCRVELELGWGQWFGFI